MSRFSLEQIAVSALEEPEFERIKGFCQRFIKQVVREKYGIKFDRYAQPTAHLSYLAWKKTRYAVDADRGSRPNDILYWKASILRPVGHVALRCTGNVIIENSVFHWTKAWGAKGFRDLSKLPKPDLIVRLPRD